MTERNMDLRKFRVGLYEIQVLPGEERDNVFVYKGNRRIATLRLTHEELELLGRTIKGEE